MSRLPWVKVVGAAADSVDTAAAAEVDMAHHDALQVTTHSTPAYATTAHAVSEDMEAREREQDSSVRGCQSGDDSIG